MFLGTRILCSQESEDKKITDKYGDKLIFLKKNINKYNPFIMNLMMKQTLQQINTLN